MKEEKVSIVQFTETLLQKMQMNVEVEMVSANNFRIVGLDCDLLKQKEGSIIDAIEHIVNKAYYKRQEGAETTPYTTIDIDSFREQRERELKALANKSKHEVLRRKTEVVLPALCARDRRVIHLAIKEDPKVESLSLGEGFYKRIRIFQANRSLYER